MHIEGSKRSLHSGHCEFKARIRVRTVTGIGHSDRPKEAVSVRTIQMYTTLSSSGKNVHMVHINRRGGRVLAEVC
jgi:hypothetical protein